MKLERNYYLNQLVRKKDNGLIKVITGIRRCGKSYLLFTLYYEYLLGIGIDDDCIIKLPLDESLYARYRNPMELDNYIRNLVSNKDRKHYVFIDEIQFVQDIDNPWLPGSSEKIGFVDVVLGLMKLSNVDLYITGSNSKMLSSEIVTQFRDKGDEIHVRPLCYSELCRAYGGDDEKLWNEYYTYGGLPRLLNLNDDRSKMEYLSGLFENTYIRDVLERNKIKNDKSIIDELIRVVASNVGSLSNPKKISDTFLSKRQISINQATIDKYLDYFIDAFILHRAHRYDVKRRKYIGTPLKYYFSDVGLRNALLGFRQQEENHIMENILYNELVARGYSVDVGVVEYRHKDESGKEIRTQLEVDFIARLGNQQFYIQSALNVDTPEKKAQETASLKRISDSFEKIVIVKANIKPWVDDSGIWYIGIRDFLNGEHQKLENI